MLPTVRTKYIRSSRWRSGRMSFLSFSFFSGGQALTLPALFQYGRNRLGYHLRLATDDAALLPVLCSNDRLEALLHALQRDWQRPTEPRQREKPPCQPGTGATSHQTRTAVARSLRHHDHYYIDHDQASTRQLPRTESQRGLARPDDGNHGGATHGYSGRRSRHREDGPGGAIPGAKGEPDSAATSGVG